jgi:hypothetical protein
VTIHGRRDLAREPAPELGVVGVFGANELHRYLPAAGRRAEEHLRHAARAEPAEQPVTADKLGVARLEGIHRSHAPEQCRIRRWTDITSLHSRFSDFPSGVWGPASSLRGDLCHQAGSGNADRPDARFCDALRQRADATGI